jgi:transglutaminase-like putative cysteine protease
MKKLTLPLAVFLVVLMFVSVSTAQKQVWQDVTQDELKMTKALVQPDADAEAILWDVYVSNEEDGMEYHTVLHHYLKVKILNDRGREAFSKIDIPFGKISELGADIKVRDIACRTTKADGSTVELKASDIFDRDIVKGSGLKLKAKSFAVPGIEAGAVIEYRWLEERAGVSLYERLEFSREIPVETVRYHIRPVEVPDMGMHGQPFNAHNSDFIREKDGFYMTTATNIAAYKDEPKSPPEYAVRPWLLLFYAKDASSDQEKYWKEYAKEMYDIHKGMMKASDDVKQATATAVAGETDDEKKVQKIFDYVRAHIKNINDDASGMSADDIKKLKENKTPSDTLKRAEGNWHDINMLFAAMVTSAGLDARVVNLPRRSDIFFPKWFTNGYFMKTENIGVNIAGKWRFFDPSSRYIPFGMLRWEEEGEPALISDNKEGHWETTPMSPAKNSLEKRSGRFKLLEDGSLDGTVRLEYSGQIAAEVKEYNDDDTQQQRDDTLKNLVRANISTSADVSEIGIENVTDPDKPFIYTFKVHIPGYATKTGKRLFFQPNVFEKGAKPMFEAADRVNDVYFKYPYAESDQIVIELPVGFELESPDAPAPIHDRDGIGSDDFTITISNDKKLLSYHRDFTWGNNGFLRFQKTSYPAVKQIFDAFYTANSHSLTLKQSTTAAK